MLEHLILQGQQDLQVNLVPSQIACMHASLSHDKNSVAAAADISCMQETFPVTFSSRLTSWLSLARAAGTPLTTNFSLKPFRTTRRTATVLSERLRSQRVYISLTNGLKRALNEQHSVKVSIRNKLPAIYSRVMGCCYCLMVVDLQGNAHFRCGKESSSGAAPTMK